jgi:ribosomal protein L37AE/L43A
MGVVKVVNMLRISKRPDNIYKGICCPDCKSPNWRRQKKTGLFVCLKCGAEYETEVSNPE